MDDTIQINFTIPEDVAIEVEIASSLSEMTSQGWLIAVVSRMARLEIERVERQHARVKTLPEAN